jgi:hypothetical protein
MTTPEQTIGPPAAPPERTSLLLRQILADLHEPTVKVGFILRKLRRRSFGGLFILLAILGLLPAVSFIAGLAMIVPAFQLALGFRAPLLPFFIRQREIDVDIFRTFVERILPWIERVERRVKPRWPRLTMAPMPTLIGVVVIGLACVVVLPLPFSNLPPAIALICLSLGFLERDGAMILAGLIVGLIALTIGVAIAYVAMEGTLFFFRQHFAIM